MYASGSGFFEEVYQIVSKIPEGSVMTYGMIAAILGRPRAARIVGYAMHDAPSDRMLPCHRVVNKEGRLSPDDIFGEGVQRKLLEQEGITFLDNGCIDMKKHLITWLP
ncbi:methylated-DNA-protein-cysteine methyltransferase-like protein [Anaerotaenia torta]|uniref:MGMT family protein n=1 Tax=Anaerotaenia torta TaxID=433293 RepID=UPI003D25523D